MNVSCPQGKTLLQWMEQRVTMCTHQLTCTVINLHWSVQRFVPETDNGNVSGVELQLPLVRIHVIIPMHKLKESWICINYIRYFLWVKPASINSILHKFVLKTIYPLLGLGHAYCISQHISVFMKTYPVISGTKKLWQILQVWGGASMDWICWSHRCSIRLRSEVFGGQRNALNSLSCSSNIPEQFLQCGIILLKETIAIREHHYHEGVYVICNNL